jgi:hypothetical protein
MHWDIRFTYSAGRKRRLRGIGNTLSALPFSSRRGRVTSNRWDPHGGAGSLRGQERLAQARDCSAKGGAESGGPQRWIDEDPEEQSPKPCEHVEPRGLTLPHEAADDSEDETKRNH